MPGPVQNLGEEGEAGKYWSRVPSFSYARWTSPRDQLYATVPIAGVLNPRAADPYWAEACWEPGRTAGGQRCESQRSFICCSPLLPIARITTWTIPTPILTPRPWKKSSTKPVLGAKKVVDCWPTVNNNVLHTSKCAKRVALMLSVFITKINK